MKNIFLICLLGSLLVSTLKCDDTNLAEGVNDQQNSDEGIDSPLSEIQSQINDLVIYRVIVERFHASVQQNITSLISQINTDSSEEDLKRINIDLSNRFQDEEAILSEYESIQSQIDDLMIELFQNQP